MLVTYLAVLYILLMITQRVFGFYTKEFIAGLFMLSFVIMIICFMKSFYIAGSIWCVTTLLEYNSFIKSES